MKKHLLSIVSVLSVYVILTAVPASAQVTRQMTVTIPFDFTVEKTTLPAGTYVVYATGSSQSDGWLMRDAEGRAGTFVMTHAVRSRDLSGKARLEFRRYGGHYFLGRVWVAESDTGRELAQSRLEREYARGREPRAVTPEVVSIAAGR